MVLIHLLNKMFDLISQQKIRSTSGSYCDFANTELASYSGSQAALHVATVTKLPMKK